MPEIEFLVQNKNERGNVDEVPSEAEPVKAASLVGSIIVSELKKSLVKTQNWNENITVYF